MQPCAVTPREEKPPQMQLGVGCAGEQTLEETSRVQCDEIGPMLARGRWARILTGTTADRRNEAPFSILVEYGAGPGSVNTLRYPSVH